MTPVVPRNRSVQRTVTQIVATLTYEQYRGPDLPRFLNRTKMHNLSDPERKLDYNCQVELGACILSMILLKSRFRHRPRLE